MCVLFSISVPLLLNKYIKTACQLHLQSYHIKIKYTHLLRIKGFRRPPSIFSPRTLGNPWSFVFILLVWFSGLTGTNSRVHQNVCQGRLVFLLFLCHRCLLFVFLKCLGGVVLDQDPIMLGIVPTQNKKKRLLPQRVDSVGWGCPAVFTSGVFPTRFLLKSMNSLSV